MRSRTVIVGILAVAVVCFAAAPVWAFPELARQTKLACATCHVNPAGGAALTEAGKAFQTDRKAPATGAAKASEYVGINKCKMCHAKQYTSWKATQHGRALAGLQKADPKLAADLAAKLKVEIKGSPASTDGCITCHVVGFQLPGGYTLADTAKSAPLANVACEACHGPGSQHVTAPLAEKKKFTNRAVTAKLCTQCHTAETSPKFNFEEYSKRGLHAMKTAG